MAIIGKTLHHAIFNYNVNEQRYIISITKFQL